MWILLAPAAAYLTWVLFFPAFTVGLLFDGSVGVLLGLYICSQPAANGIDLMFMQRGAFRRICYWPSGCFRHGALLPGGVLITPRQAL